MSDGARCSGKTEWGLGRDLAKQQGGSCVAVGAGGAAEAKALRQEGCWAGGSEHPRSSTHTLDPAPDPTPPTPSQPGTASARVTHRMESRAHQGQLWPPHCWGKSPASLSIVKWATNLIKPQVQGDLLLGGVGAGPCSEPPASCSLLGEPPHFKGDSTSSDSMKDPACKTHEGLAGVSHGGTDWQRPQHRDTPRSHRPVTSRPAVGSERGQPPTTQIAPGGGSVLVLGHGAQAATGGHRGHHTRALEAPLSANAGLRVFR